MMTLPDADVDDRTTVAASVLCFAVCDRGNLYFLLGKEAGRRVGKADSWSDFGGRANVEDADAEATALREFTEESMGLVQFVHAGLADKSHVAALAVSMSTTTRHVCFLKQVVWQPDLPATFLRMRILFNNMRTASKQVAWLMRNHAPRMHLLDYLVHAGVSRAHMASAVALLDETVRVEYRGVGGAGATTTWRTFDVCALAGVARDDWMHYANYISLVRQMSNLWYDMPAAWRAHPALRCTWWRGHLVRIVVCRHYLEMQCLRWWSLPYCHELIQKRGRCRKNTLRPCFLPTLRLMLDYLARSHHTHDLVFDPAATATGPQRCAVAGMN